MTDMIDPHADHLSMRVTTDTNGTKIADSGHYPFGESWYETGGVNKLKFTSYERDAGANESGNDYAIFCAYCMAISTLLTSPEAVRAVLERAAEGIWAQMFKAIRRP
jgi:hypothetical protein